MTRYLVTGGAGFIGSHLVEALLQRGEMVRVLDNFSTGKRENLAGLHGRLEIMEADVRDPERMRQAVQDVEVIFHHAAFISASASMQEPQACFAVNVTGTLNLLEAARQAHVRKVVLASSTAVYGDSDSLPIAEDTPLNPFSPYALSKQINEACGALYTRSFDLPVVSLRYFNVYGPRQSPDSQYAAAIPLFIRALLDRQPVTIFGDGRQTRDFIFVKDVVQANLLAAESGAAGEALNICTGHETSLFDLLENLSEIVPDGIKAEFSPPRPGDIYRSVGNPEQASALLKFRARTPLASGLKETIEWLKR